MTRRPALGNLVNRADKARIVPDKKATANANATNDSGAIDLKNVKARVDTHWKNEPIRKQLSRNNSLKKAPLTSVNGSTSALAGPKLVKIKTTQTATLKEAKLADKSDRLALLKRQDSTLTRRKPFVGTTKTGDVDATKRTVTRTKSSDSEGSVASTKVIQDGPVIQSRFRPPTETSYSNGLIDGVSVSFPFFFIFFQSNFLTTFFN